MTPPLSLRGWETFELPTYRAGHVPFGRSRPEHAETRVISSIPPPSRPRPP